MGCGLGLVCGGISKLVDLGMDLTFGHLTDTSTSQGSKVNNLHKVMTQGCTFHQGLCKTDMRRQQGALGLRRVAPAPAGLRFRCGRESLTTNRPDRGRGHEEKATTITQRQSGTRRTGLSDRDAAVPEKLACLLYSIEEGGGVIAYQLNMEMSVLHTHKQEGRVIMYSGTRRHV